MAYSISNVAVCNMALLQLGAKPISSLSETTTEAVACNSQYDYLRRNLLRLHPWNFAIKQIELAQEVSTPVFDYDYKYTLPSDCVRLWKVLDNGDYKIQGRSILTSEKTCKIEYVYDNTDPSTWDAAFVEVMVASIRHAIAYTITESGSEVERSGVILKEKLQKAKSIDGSEDINDEYGRYDSVLISSRY